jgi:outer membrane receptor protein involved in Fe transport
MTSKVKLALASGVAATALLQSMSAWAQDRFLDIPSEAAAQSIPEFARQADLQIIAPVSELRDTKTPRISGNLDVQTALNTLIAGTGLEVADNRGGVVILRRGAAASATDAVGFPGVARPPESDGIQVAQLTPGTQVAQASQAETVVVTGSRVISNIANSPTPLTSVSNAEMQQMTPTSVADALIRMPALTSSVSPRQNNQHLTVLNLRNFGATRTLVLMDGHRVAPSLADGTVGLETLPMTLMTQTDVVTGGASAVYGSDAVTGVVNFVLDKNFNGLKADFNSGISSYGDGASYKLDLAGGTSLFGGRGNFEFALSTRHRDMVYNSARPFGWQPYAQTGGGTAQNPFVDTAFVRRPTAPFGGVIISCGACAASGYNFYSQGILTPYNPGNLTGTSNVTVGGDGGWNKYGSALNEINVNTAFSRFSYDIDDTTTFYINATASETRDTASYFPIKIGPVTFGGLYYRNNPFLPTGTQTMLGNNGTNPAFLVSTTNAALNPNVAAGSNATNTFIMGKFLDGGPSQEQGERSVNRLLSFSTGLDGKFAGYSWGLYYSHGEARQNVTVVANQDYQHLYAAQDAVLASVPANSGPGGTSSAVGTTTVQCYAATQAATKARYGNCVPLNPFGPGPLSQAEFNYINPDTSTWLTNKMDNLEASISGSPFETWAGPVIVALSGEARFMSLDIVAGGENRGGLVDCTGLRLCDANAFRWLNGGQSMSASYDVMEGALEANVPLLKDVPLVQDLNVNLAGRYTNYSTSGGVQTWKIGLNWAVNDELRFRSTWSVDIRAPNLFELYQPTTTSSGSGFFDRYTGRQDNTQVVTSGNSKLLPEVARTFTAGVVVTPDFIPNFSASVDYYRVRLHNAIGQVSGTSPSIQDLCINSAGTSIYCSLYVRPNPFSDRSINNYPTRVYSNTLNTALVEIEGFDLEANYVFDWFGNWSARLLGNYQPVNQNQAYPGAPFTFTTVPPNSALIAKTHITGSLNYQIDAWTFSVQDRWLGSYSRVTTPPTPLNPQVYATPMIKSQNYINLNLQRDFDIGGYAMSGYFNVQNLLNNKGQVYENGSVQGIHYPIPAEQDIMGRYLTLGARFSF